MTILQTSMSQAIISQIESLPPYQMQEVLNFIDFLKFKTAKIEKSNDEKLEQVPISHFAGMAKLPKTNEPRSLFDFDPASIATDEK